MSRSLILASAFAAGALALSAPCSDLSAYEHLGCVVAKTNSFPRHYPGLGHLGCSSTCSTNGNIVALGDGCSCDRLDLAERPIPYHVTKVDDSLCSNWCDPADPTKGTCGGGIYQGYQVFDLYKRSNAIVVFDPLPGTHVVASAVPTATPGPVIIDGGRHPGDVFHDCPSNVVDCPYRQAQKCTTGNCHQVQPVPVPVPVPAPAPVPQVCHGCGNHTRANWTRPASYPDTVIVEVPSKPCSGEHCVPDDYYDQDDNGCSAHENEGDACPVYHPGDNAGGEGTKPVVPVKPIQPAQPAEPSKPTYEEDTGTKGVTPACVGEHCYIVTKPINTPITTPVIVSSGVKVQAVNVAMAISVAVVGFSLW